MCEIEGGCAAPSGLAKKIGAVSLTQAGELTRYGDASRREGRYQVLDELAPIRTDFPTTQGGPAGPRTLFEREILNATGERGLIPPSVIGPLQLTEWTDVLPGRLDASVTDYLRATMENKDYQDVENRMYDAARFAAAAEKLDGQREENRRVRDLPHTPVPPEKVPDCSDQLLSPTRVSALGALPIRP